MKWIHPARYANQGRGRRAFTLVEIIVVIVLIGILVSLGTPVLYGVIKANALRRGGDKVQGLLVQARQIAVSKNTMTAFILLGDAGTPEDYRAFAILEYQPESGWAQTSAWEMLPDGIIVDFSDEASSFLKNSPHPLPSLSDDENSAPVEFRQQRLNDTDSSAARVFTSTGAVWGAQHPARLRLVRGSKVGDQLQIEGAVEGKTGNYYSITIVGATGLLKVSRP